MSISNNLSVFSFFFFFFFFFLLVFLISSTLSLSFNLSNITPSDSRFINITGDGYISYQGIQVTTDERNQALGNRTGRATYIEPLHLWDKLSRNLTDFTTHFSFVVDSRGSNSFADGLTFFLAPIGSSIQPWSYGESLGIGNKDLTVNSSSDSFVAVEFDTFPNWYDHNMPPHVGIDINSMRSVVTAIWPNNITQGPQNDAWISYNATTMELRVDFTGNSSNVVRRNSISHVVDLRDYLPENVTVGFSAATGLFFETHNIKSWSFSSTLQLINVTSPSPSSGPGVVIPGGGKEKQSGLIVGLGVGLSIVVVGSAFAGYCLCMKKKTKKGNEESVDEEDFFDPQMDIEFQKGTGPKKFRYSELVVATKDFAEDEKLGEGGFGGVYRGLLTETNSEIAVKRVSRGSKQGLKEYASEVKIISQLRHRNLVQLIGWCHERGELLLVYEFMPNGSLDAHLFKGQSVLPWETRYKIAQGLASALLYLHEEWERAVVHRDIKASNIMLDSNFNAKLGDFGLARLVDHEKGSQTTVLAGTMGYMAPECVITGRASKETDVYSLGIVFLEIACGRRPIDRRRDVDPDRVVLVEWVWGLYGKGMLLEAADPKLGMEFDEREMERLMTVGLWCVHPDSGQRPSIRQAILVLGMEVDLPELPSVMPVPTYFGPRIVSSALNSSSHNALSDSSSYNHYSDSSNVTGSSGGSATALLTSS